MNMDLCGLPNTWGVNCTACNHGSVWSASQVFCVEYATHVENFCRSKQVAVTFMFHRVHICDEHRCARGATWNGIKPIKKAGMPFCDFSMARFIAPAFTSFSGMPGKIHIEPELDGLARMVGNGVGVLAWCGFGL